MTIIRILLAVFAILVIASTFVAMGIWLITSIL